MTASYGQVVIALLVALLVSASEIASRYRDQPLRAVFSWPAVIYGMVNSAAALAALFALTVYGGDFGIKDNPNAVLLLRGFVAGTGAAAIFRSALFTVRVAEQDVAIGPIMFLQVLLQVIDREVDRERARDRAQRIGDIMAGLSFDQVAVGLPAYCLVLMQNLDEKQQKAIGEEIRVLRESPHVPDPDRLLILGLYLANAIGLDTLAEVTKTYRNQPAALKK